MRVSTILLAAFGLLACSVITVSAATATSPGRALGHCKEKGVGHTNSKHSYDAQCVQDCEFTVSAWSACSTTCGVGSRSRITTITEPAANGGIACPSKLVEVASCDTGVPCPVNCEFTVTPWSACSATCGTGTSTQVTTVFTPAAFGGKECPTVLEETKTCETGVTCPIDCAFTVGEWTGCSASCGSGVSTRTTTIQTQPAFGGMECPTELVETQSCDSGVSCPIDCAFTVGEWTGCSASCGSGVSTRTTTIQTQDAFGGKKCPTELVESQTCDSGVSCAVNCASTVGEWSACSNTCGDGLKTRSTTITTPASNGGTPCPTELTETATCNNGPCPIDCVMSEWTVATTCGVCGGGTSTSTRTIVTEAAFGGAACPTDLVRTDAVCAPLSAFNTVVNIYSPSAGVYLTRSGSTIGYSYNKADAMAVRFEAKCDEISAPFALYSEDGLALIRSFTRDNRWGCSTLNGGYCHYLLEFSSRATTQYWDIHRTWADDALSYAKARGITKLSELFGTSTRPAVNTGLSIGGLDTDRSTPEMNQRTVLTLRAGTAAVAMPWWYGDEYVHLLQA